MSINIGAIASNYAGPALKNMQCFGRDADECYTVAFAVCGGVMFVSWIIFIIGKHSYRIIPSAGIFLPWVIVKVIFLAITRYISDGGRMSLLKYVENGI